MTAGHADTVATPAGPPRPASRIAPVSGSCWPMVELSEHDQYFRFFGPIPLRLDDLVFAMAAPMGMRHGSMGAFWTEN